MHFRSCDFLPAAFDLFPDCEFCVITVPHLVPEFPLLQQFVVSQPCQGGMEWDLGKINPMLVMKWQYRLSGVYVSQLLVFQPMRTEYSGACILRPLVEPTKYGIKLKVVLKWRDIYMKG